MNEANNICVGVGKTDITPPVGTELTGYGFYLNRNSRGIHLPSYSRVILLRGENEEVLIFSNDLLDIDEQIIRRSRALIHSRLGISENKIIFTSTHTHSGPATSFLRGVADISKEYTSSLPAKFLEAAIEAHSNLKRASFGVGRKRISGISYNRALKGGPIDGELMVIYFEDLRGKPIATIFNFSCHPVAINVKTDAGYYISPDWPGCAMKIIGEKIGGISIFLQGACGDINPLMKHKAKGFEVAEEIGRVIATETISIIENLKLRESGQFGFGSSIVELPTQPIDYKYVAEELSRFLREYEKNRDSLPDGILRFYAEWSEDILRRMKRGFEEGIRSRIYAVRIGENALLFLPGEVFVEIGLEIKRRSPFVNTMVIGYTDKCVGYIPAEWDFDMRGYASTIAPKVYDHPPYQKSVGRVLANKCLELLDYLKSSEPQASEHY